MSDLPEEDDGEVKEAIEVSERDKQMHRQWVESGYDPEHLVPLLRRYQPFIESKTRQLSSGALTNAAAVRQNVTNHVIEGFRTYDPSRGTVLNTHVQNRAKAALRSVIAAQNMSRIPEANALQIGKIDRARAQFEEDMGAPPSLKELADHMGMPLKKLQAIEKSRVRDISSGGSEIPLTQQGVDRSSEVRPLILRQIQRDLPGSLEEKVFKAIYGEEGTGVGTPVRTSDLARKFGVADHYISRARTSIANRLKEHGG